MTLMEECWSTGSIGVGDEERVASRARSCSTARLT